MMAHCVNHVDYKLPNELTHVKFLPDAIKCKYHGLNEAITMLKGNKGPTVNMNKFEDEVA